MPVFTPNYAKYYNLIYEVKDYEKEAEFVYKWANKPKKILELGCGTGLHAKYWAKHAYYIVGLDKSKTMLKLAYQHPHIKYFLHPLEKLKDFPWINCDCVMAMFNVMGYCLLEECLPHLPLTRGGYFIFDVWDASKFKHNPPIPKVKHLETAYRVAVSEQISKRILRIDYIIVEGKKIQVFERHFVQGYFQKDIEQLCRLYKYKIADIKSTKDWSVWYKLVKI